MDQATFDAIALGTVGTVLNTETGLAWDGQFTITGKRTVNSTPPKQLLTVESVRRRIQRIPGNLAEGKPDTYVETTDAFERCTDLPADWFTPTPPAAPAVPAPTPAAKK